MALGGRAGAADPHAPLISGQGGSALHGWRAPEDLPALRPHQAAPACSVHHEPPRGAYRNLVHLDRARHSMFLLYPCALDRGRPRRPGLAGRRGGGGGSFCQRRCCYPCTSLLSSHDTNGHVCTRLAVVGRPLLSSGSCSKPRRWRSASCDTTGYGCWLNSRSCSSSAVPAPTRQRVRSHKRRRA